MPGCRVDALGQIDDHLHADCPVALMVAVRHAEVFVELPADRAHGAVADHGQGRVNVHAGHEVGFRISGAIDTLIAQADAADAFLALVDDGAFDRACRARSAQCPDIMSCSPTHCMNCPSERTRPSCFCRNGGHVGQFDGVIAGETEEAHDAVGGPQGCGAAAGAAGIEQVDDLLFA